MRVRNLHSPCPTSLEWISLVLSFTSIGARRRQVYDAANTGAVMVGETVIAIATFGHDTADSNSLDPKNGSETRGKRRQQQQQQHGQS